MPTSFRARGAELLSLLLLAACAHSPAPTLSLLPASPPPAATEETEEASAQTLRQKGFDAYREGDYPRAIACWEAESLVEPQSFSVWTEYLLAYGYMVTGRYAEARALAERLVKNDPYQPLPYQQLGLAQLWLGKPKAALDNFHRALDFDSHAPRVHFYLGLAEEALGRSARRDDAFALGVKEYDEILKENPGDFSANYELTALLLFWNHDLDRASLTLAEAKRHFGNAPEAELQGDRHLFLSYYVPLLEGILDYRKGELASAHASLMKALTALPSDARADAAELYHYLGQTYAGLGNAALARSFLQKSVTSDPSGPYAASSGNAMGGITSRRSTSF